MTPSIYITECLKNLRHGQPAGIKNGTAADIYRLLLSHKFRKYAVNPEYLEHIRHAIDLSMKSQEPIKLTIVFGGYKLWRLKESPYVDWAELFALMYYARWLLPITAIYTPGVWLDFYSDDVILESMDNIPKQNTEAYKASFRALLTFIMPFLPKNLRFTLNCVSDQYALYEDFLTELEENKKKVVSELGGLPKLSDEQLRLVELNVHLKPGQAGDPEWREKVFLIHEAYARISKRRPYYRTPEKIFVITRPIKDSIAVGTTKTSVVKFWIGAGALERNGDSYTQHIYSPTQLTAHTFDEESADVHGLTGKNFHSIKIQKTL